MQRCPHRPYLIDRCAIEAPGNVLRTDTTALICCTNRYIAPRNEALNQAPPLAHSTTNRIYALNLTNRISCRDISSRLFRECSPRRSSLPLLGHSHTAHAFPHSLEALVLAGLPGGLGYRRVTGGSRVRSLGPDACTVLVMGTEASG